MSWIDWALLVLAFCIGYRARAEVDFILTWLILNWDRLVKPCARFMPDNWRETFESSVRKSCAARRWGVAQSGYFQANDDGSEPRLVTVCHRIKDIERIESEDEEARQEIDRG